MSQFIPAHAITQVPSRGITRPSTQVPVQIITQTLVHAITQVPRLEPQLMLSLKLQFIHTMSLYFSFSSCILSYTLFLFSSCIHLCPNLCPWFTLLFMLPFFLSIFTYSAIYFFFSSIHSDPNSYFQFVPNLYHHTNPSSWHHSGSRLIPSLTPRRKPQLILQLMLSHRRNL